MSELSGYFDYNATTPMSAEAKEVLVDAASGLWHNPSSLYREAGRTKMELEQCREEVADHLGIDEPERIIFTSGATEANNAILRHLATQHEGRLLISAIEHPCVEAPAGASFGPDRIELIPVDPVTGVVKLEAVSASLARGGVAAVSAMAANNETGVLQPWSGLSACCREHGVPFHTDAAQWIGKLPAAELGECDYVTGSGHKFGGGKGVGFMVIPDGEEAFHGFIGGPQEDGRRAGTENLPAVMAMVAALCARDDAMLSDLAAAQSDERDEFERLVSDRGLRVIGADGPRLWNTSMLVLPHSKNLKWLTRLSQRGFSVSTGSACSAGKGNPSRVMAAMGLDYGEMGRVLRVSGGWDTSPDDWRALAEAIREVGAELAP